MEFVIIAILSWLGFGAITATPFVGNLPFERKHTVPIISALMLTCCVAVFNTLQLVK